MSTLSEISFDMAESGDTDMRHAPTYKQAMAYAEAGAGYYRGYAGYRGYTAPQPEASRDWASYVREARQHPTASVEWERLYDLAERARRRDLGSEGRARELAQALAEAEASGR